MEVCPSGLWYLLGKQASPVRGTGGSNPPTSANFGWVREWIIRSVSKTEVPPKGDRGFESHPNRHFTWTSIITTPNILKQIETAHMLPNELWGGVMVVILNS